MAARPLAAARAMRSCTCEDVIQPCWRDPGRVWSRASQNLGDDNLIIEGTDSLVGILSILSLREYGCVVTKVNQERYDVLRQCLAIIFCKRRGKLIHHLMEC